MARRGRKRRLDLESEYWLLLASGVGTVEAYRLVGIGRKTGSTEPGTDQSVHQIQDDSRPGSGLIR